MRRPVLLAAATIGVLALVAPSSAASKPQLTDLVGDANGLNSQAVGLPVPGVATAPASYGAADIVSVTLETTWKRLGTRKLPNGFSVTMQLSAAPAPGVTYAVSATVPKTCDGEHSDLRLSYQDYDAFQSSLAYCADSSEVDGAQTDMLVEVVADPARRTVTWRLAKGMSKGAKVEGIVADTSVFVLGVYDEAAGGRAYTYGT